MNTQQETRNLDHAAVAKTCKLKGRDGRFMLVRMGPNNSRVATLEPPRGVGFKVKNTDLEDIQGVVTIPRLARIERPTDLPVNRPHVWFPRDPAIPLPFGLADLDPLIVTDDKGRIRCYVKGCDHYLCPPCKGFQGDTCPVHGIRCHTSGTYTFPKPEAYRNVIADRSLFERLETHPFKFESRCHYEKSEDAVTASVFLSLQAAGCLHLILRWLLGHDHREEAVQLYLWGINTRTLKPLDLLVAARNRFERGLPHGRPYSEPDVMLQVPGRLLLIIEAKLTSENPIILPDRPRATSISLTHEEVLNRYNDLELAMLDVKRAKDAPLPQQLYRYGVLVEWMARMCEDGTRPYLCNLTRAYCDPTGQELFRELIRPEYRDRFSTATWEEVYTLTGFERVKLTRLRQYLEQKTVNLRQCFHLGKIWRAA